MERKIYIYRTIQEIETGANRLAKELTDSKRSDPARYLGFDEEYSTIIDSKEAKKNRVSLIQLATNEAAHLFHVHELAVLPPALESLLMTEKIVKIGYATTNDILLTRSTFSLSIRVLDLQQIITLIGGSGWGLSDAIQKYCGYSLDKTQQWSGREWSTMNEKQIRYAAMDAFACVDLWQAISPCLCRNIPSPMVVPIPIFSKTEKIDYADIREWLKTIPAASNKESMSNQLMNSYAPWSKLSHSMKKELCDIAVEELWKEKDVEEEVTRAINLLISTHPTGVSRKKTKILAQLYNSIGLLSCEPCTKEKKQERIAEILEELIREGWIKKYNELEICLAD